MLCIFSTDTVLINLNMLRCYNHGIVKFLSLPKTCTTLLVVIAHPVSDQHFHVYHFIKSLMEVSLSWLPHDKSLSKVSIIASGNTRCCKLRSSDYGLYDLTRRCNGILLCLLFVPKVILLWGLHPCISANIGIFKKHIIISITKCKMWLGIDGDFNHG